MIHTKQKGDVILTQAQYNALVANNQVDPYVKYFIKDSDEYPTKTEAQGYATTAKTEAVSAAALDATAKANQAETNAKAASRPSTWMPSADDVGAIAKTVPATVGNIATLDANGNLVDGGKKLDEVGGGKRFARFTVGTSTAGWTAQDCDYLCDGTADQVEINAAIQALQAAGGEVAILDGTYNITAPITINKTNVTLSGNGNATVLKRMWNAASETDGVIAVDTQKNYSHIRSLRIDGTSQSFIGVNCAGIVTKVCDNCVITESIFENCVKGVRLFGYDAGIASHRNVVTKNVFLNCATGVDVIGQANTVSMNIFSSATGGTGVALGRGYGNSVDGNTFRNGSYGVTANTNYENAITGNTFYNNSMAAMYLASSNGNTIAGNTAKSNKDGLLMNGSSNNSITGNTILNNSNAGIYMAGSNHRNAVLGNVVNDNTYGIFMTESNNNNISCNTVIRGTGLPTDYTGTQTSIQLSGTGNNGNLISDNMVMGKSVTVNGGTGNEQYTNKYT